ncbi:Arsenate reductase [Tenacibaculum sp. 190524A02b]|uniref:Arsenate reductase n=1 Tax=Tenacibaculum vairaonense TaxID=3137860 RepID=A0ABM9PI11_9FLAO
MNTTLLQTIKNLDTSSISEERKLVLSPLINTLQVKLKDNQPIQFNFICTHNSRRSHLSQIWMQTLASYFKVSTISCYSGGTEATAIAPQVIKALTKQGFSIHTLSEGSNLVYAIKYAENSMPIIGFSKEYFHNFNPSSNFIAIMTCSQADDGCPFVAGAEKRIPITYEDPKAFDNTELEAEKYLERSIQIATELYYILNAIT